MGTPTPRAVYEWLAPIREKCAEAWPERVYLMYDTDKHAPGCWGDKELSLWLAPEVAHDLIALHMLRWLRSNRVDYEYDTIDLEGAAWHVAAAQGIPLAPWPGGE